MSSLTTTTISHASSGVQQPAASSIAKDATQGQPQNSQQLAQLSQMAAQKAKKLGVDDKKRGVRIEKRPEASFSSKEEPEEEKGGQVAKKKRPRDGESGSHLDLSA